MNDTNPVTPAPKTIHQLVTTAKESMPVEVEGDVHEDRARREGLPDSPGLAQAHMKRRTMKKADFYKMDPAMRSDVEILDPSYIDEATGKRVYVDFFQTMPPAATPVVNQPR